MKFITITLFTLCLVSLLLHTAAGQGFSVSPSRITFSGNPGETVTQTITFSNSSPTSLSFVNRIQDWERDSTGRKVYYDSNTRALSNAGWINLSSNTTTLKAGETKQVIVSMTIPATTNKLTHSIIFFTQVKDQQPKEIQGISLGINVLMEVGVQVYYIPKGLNSGELKFLAFDDRGTVDKDGKKFRQVALRIQNTGSVNKDAYVRFELTNKETGEEVKIEPQIIAMLPEATQWVNIDLPVSLKGTFLAVAMLDAGSTYDLKVAEKEIIYRP